MKIELSDRIIEEMGNISSIMKETTEEYILRAIMTQMQIDKVVLEDDITETEEWHEYQMMPGQSARIKRVMKDKGLSYEELKKNGRVFIKAKVSPKDFMYLDEISENHSLPVRLPVSMGDISERKVSELEEMYGTTLFMEP